MYTHTERKLLPYTLYEKLDFLLLYFCLSSPVLALLLVLNKYSLVKYPLNGFYAIFTTPHFTAGAEGLNGS